jgi:DNA-binding transcriptional MerR regulator
MALKTGEVAELGGVNLQTIRDYEREGLVPEPPRLASGYRMFPPDTVRRVRFIKRAQDLGFTLAEIKELHSTPTRSETAETSGRSQMRSPSRRCPTVKMRSFGEWTCGIERLRNHYL